jgi:hypothetical protein
VVCDRDGRRQPISRTCGSGVDVVRKDRWLHTPRTALRPPASAHTSYTLASSSKTRQLLQRFVRAEAGASTRTRRGVLEPTSQCPLAGSAPYGKCRRKDEDAHAGAQEPCNLFLLSAYQNSRHAEADLPILQIDRRASPGSTALPR